MLENLSENMTKKEIKQAEEEIKSIENMLKGLSEWQGDWEKFGVDLKEIDSSARADFGILGEEAFLEGRGDKIDQFKQELRNAEEMVRISKENLKKKQSKSKRRPKNAK